MERVIEYTLQAKEDITFFKKSGQSDILKKIRKLI
jgi:Txe/YoeB family toxin of Txe-Axe toxin-antitoxin module